MEQPLVLLARHGETETNQRGEFHGWIDDPLSDKGIQDAQEAADFISHHFKPTLIFASPLQRAMKTAQIANQKLGVPLEVDHRLIGWDNGVLAGRKQTPELKQVRDFYVQHPEQKIPGGQKFPGESIATQEGRFGAILDKALAYGRNGGLALLETHGSGLKAAQTILTGHREPHGDASLVHGGGVAAVYARGNKFELRPIFKAAQQHATAS